MHIYVHFDKYTYVKINVMYMCFFVSVVCQFRCIVCLINTCAHSVNGYITSYLQSFNLWTFIQVSKSKLTFFHTISIQYTKAKIVYQGSDSIYFNFKNPNNVSEKHSDTSLLHVFSLSYKIEFEYMNKLNHTVGNCLYMDECVCVCMHGWMS